MLRPEHLAALRVDRAEPAVGGAVEDEVTGGRQGAAHRHELLLDRPDLLAGDRIPGHELAPVAAGRGVALHLHAVVRRAGDVRLRVVGDVHADVEDAGVDEPGARRERRRLPVLAADVGRADVRQLDVRLRLHLRHDDRHAGLQVDALRPVLVGERLRRPAPRRSCGRSCRRRRCDRSGPAPCAACPRR